VSVYQAYRYSINDIFKTLLLVITLFPLCFRHFVPFKVVHFLHICILAYFITVFGAYSVYKKFLTLPLVHCSFARGPHWDFGLLVRFKSEFSS